MKIKNYSKITTLLTAIVTAVMVSNCSTNIGVKPTRTAVKHKHLPPGQAKKVYGSQSARQYAPGQNKRS